MKNFIYLEPDEDVAGAIKKIKRAKEKNINLVIPEKSSIFSAKNLKQLVDLGKKITIFSNDSDGLFLAKENGLDISATDNPNPNPKDNKTAPTKSAPSTLKKIKIVYKKTSTSKSSTEQKLTTEKPPVTKPITSDSEPKKSSSANKNIQQPSFFSQIVLGIISLISIIVIVLVFLLVVPTTDITVTTQAQKVNLDTTITLDTKQTEVDTINNIIPAQQINIDEELTQEERATGEVNNGQRATGVITVYNQSASDLPLVGNSRFASSQGLIYRTTSSVNVPAGGTANVNVAADFIGSKGNIGADKFTLPALPGLESLIYGQSNATFSGGTDEITYVITENDLQYSLEEIKNKIYEKAINDLKTKLPSDRKYISLSPDQITVTINPDHQVGDQVETFNLVAKSTVPFMIYQDKDLISLIKNHLSKNMSKTRTVTDDQYQNYNQQVLNTDVAAGHATVNITSSAQTTPAYNLEKIKKDLVGKSEEEVKAYFLSDQYREIQQIDIHFWPDWVKRVSKIPSRISINIIYK